MSLFLLLPVGLAALAALLLPLLLHLARRSEPRLVPFAALRWLRAQPQPRQRHRLEELLLLLLRLLLLLALALLLAQPMLSGNPDRRPRIALAPGVDAATARAAIPANAQGADAVWLRLSPGFPPLDDSSPRDPQPQPGPAFASLLRELDAQLPSETALTVVVPAVLDGADAQRPVLSRDVRWHVLRDDGNAATTAQRPATPQSTAMPAQATTRPLRLQVRASPQHAQALRYLRAAGVAWALPPASEASAGDTPIADKPTPAQPEVEAGGTAQAVSVVALAAPLDTSTSHLAWLSAGPVPDHIRDWVRRGGRVLLSVDAQWPQFPADAPVIWRDEEGPLARAIRHGRGRVVLLQRPWRAAQMPVLLEPSFPQQLRGLLSDPPPAPTRVTAADYAPSRGLAAWPESPRPLAPWLVWLIAALFIVERWLAAGPRRSAAP